MIALRRRTHYLAMTGFVALTLAPRAEAATRPFVVYDDDGTLAKGPSGGVPSYAKKLLERYDSAGLKRPDVLSIWTTFPLRKDNVGTYVLPLKNDVKGIGMEKEHGGDGLFDEGLGCRAVLIHNNVRFLGTRATLAGTNKTSFAEYLFLLELSHLWGPAARLPASASVPSVPVDALIGFTYHWSFFMDGGGSVAGGNVWNELGGGRFRAKTMDPDTLGFSKLDLYLMGMAEPSEVPPFSVLTDVENEGAAVDPYTDSPVSPTTFPWFADTEVTVKAMRKTVTVDDVIAANGPRVPSAKDSPRNFTLGIALAVAPDTPDTERAEVTAQMDLVAKRLAPAFSRATSGRGSLEVITVQEVADAAAEPNAAAQPQSPGNDGMSPPAATPTPAPAESGGCATLARHPRGEQIGIAMAGMALLAVSRRLRRRTR